MRKRIIDQRAQDKPVAEERWLDLESLAQVEVTSEDASHRIESALLPGSRSGWQAAEPGEQTIRILFDGPQTIRHIRLVFEETVKSRTQEFVLRWTSDARNYRDIVRQQYNFSPPGSTLELEDYTVDLQGLTALELDIVPDISGGDARASLAQLRLA